MFHSIDFCLIFLLTKFVKKYAELSNIIYAAIEKYKEEVKKGQFPSREHVFSIKEEELKKI